MNWKRSIAGLVILFCVALISLYFLVPNFTSQIVMPDNTDNHLSMSVAVHVARALATGNWGDLYHFPIYYPLPYTLTAGVNMFGQGALIAPLWAFGVRSLPLLYNLLLLFALIMAGLGARRLFSSFDVPYHIALFGAALLVLHPFKQISYLHLNMIFFFPLIWGLADLVNYLREDKRRYLIFMSLWLVVQGLFDLSLFFFSVIVFVGFWLTGVLMVSGRKVKALLEGLAAFIFSGVTVIALFWTYLDNPLKLQYSRGSFDMMTLIPGYYLFSAWHPLTISRYQLFNMPLFIGGVAFFMLADFFWRPGRVLNDRFILTGLWWGVFTLSVLIPFSLPLLGGVSGENLLLAGDLGFIIILLLVAGALIWFFPRFSVLERWLGAVLLSMGLFFFQAPYRVLPDALNPLNILSHLLPQLSRSRGYRLYFYVFIVLLLIAVLGFSRWLSVGSGLKKRPRLLIGLLVFVWFFEIFPSKLATGPALDPRRSALFSQLDKTRIDSGVLILPHFKGDPYENIYLPHLFDTHRSFYNGCLGVGISDPLGLYHKDILGGGSRAIAKQIGSQEVIGQLVEGRILTLVVDRLMLWDWENIPGGEAGASMRLQYGREWRELLAAFREAKRSGLLLELIAKPDGLVATIKDRLVGDRVCYRIGCRNISSQYCEMRVKVDGPFGTIVRAVIDDVSVGEKVIYQSGQYLSWPISTSKEVKPIRSMEFFATEKCEFTDFEFR